MFSVSGSTMPAPASCRTYGDLPGSMGGETGGGQQLLQPLLGIAVFGEDDHPLFIPLAVGAQGLGEPRHQVARFAIGAGLGLVRPGAHLL